MPDDASLSSSGSTPKVATESKPDPKFAVFQKVLSKDSDTPLLYEAIVRKAVYAPKSKKLNICLMESSEEVLIHNDLDAIMAQDEVFSWHYFVHYHGWNVKWDRWVEEDQLYPDTPDSRALAKRLKEESKILKRGTSQKKVLEVMQRIVRLERELREKQARGESIDEEVKETDNTGIQKNDEVQVDPKKVETNKKEKMTNNFLMKEMDLWKKSLTSRKCSINLPFSLKKILTDDWEIITQCKMLHSIPATVSVMDALNAYCERKVKVMHETEMCQNEEENKSNHDSLNGSSPMTKDHANPLAHNEWTEMIQGIALFFDQALPKRLLFRHEIPQCLLLEERYNLRYCELYPCEYLVRMCIKLPEYLDDAKQISEDDKSKILFKIGDLLRFLNKHQDQYLLQRYRKITDEENAKAERLKKRLGMDKEDLGNDHDTIQNNDNPSRDTASGVDTGEYEDMKGNKRKNVKGTGRRTKQRCL